MIMPLTPIILAWLFGVWGASRIAVPTVALGFGWRGGCWYHPLVALALAAMLGALRYSLASTSLATYNDQQMPVIVEGIVG
jgi:hypothetical protein